MIRIILGSVLVVVGTLMAASGGDTAMFVAQGLSDTPENATMPMIIWGTIIAVAGLGLVFWGRSSRRCRRHSLPGEWTFDRNFGFKGTRGEPNRMLLEDCAPEGPSRRMYTPHEEYIHY